MLAYRILGYVGRILDVSKSLEGRECPTVDIEIYNKRRKEILAKQ